MLVCALAPAVVALSSDVDFSNGSDVAIEQTLLKATDWFLTEQEITDSRGGVPRNDLSVYTTGNAVKAFTITKEYFDAVYDDLSAAGEGDRILLAAWDSKLVQLKPDVDITGHTSGYHKVFSGVVERGGEVSILAWANLLRRGHNIEARDAVNSLPASSVNGARATFIFDDRAYVGGLDLTNDRWNTIYHNNSALRDAAGIMFRHKGWVDGEFRIHGSAAKGVANSFLARWNSDYKPCQGLADDLLDFENPEFKQLLRWTTSVVILHRSSVLKTYRSFELSVVSTNTEFAPSGGNSLFHARIKAIKNARNYIYIEDQYFILVPELFEALMEVIPRLQKKQYPNKFKVYTTKLDRDIYIHSKIVIIDDVYPSVGSANWNRRSMTSDSELNANVVNDDRIESPDGITVNKLARDFRIHKFHEMTGVSYDKLDAMTFLNAAHEYDVAAADNLSLLQTLEAEYHLYYVSFTDLVRQQADPQDTCT
ncbi:hypothetical protein F441_04542 [Phytophthora nicotianae CJ01A1]|uniref:phospholipase D n=1 Tax=Phytophthora nicotianae CJ01A1 TaxID=1317063 RepID=W2XHF9_PHYNI|nr:hypothetical protein F441_04542 [Phytophthora nicotianae CJ01A1]